MRFVVLMLLAGCMTPVMSFGEGKTAKQAQHDTMASFGPARLATGEKWAGEVTTSKVRVWADGPYRTQNIHWQESFESALELANVVITPILGVNLVAEYVEWDRNVPGATLRDDIAALQERDPGDNAFAVIGLTSSLTLVSATFEELGVAMVGGRHMMLRGYADLLERKVYANAFPDLRPEEREMALVHLRHHKTAVVLLHELGHVLGVDHEIDSSTIMNASYSNHANAFSAASRSVMLASVDQRLRRKSVPDATPVATAVQATAQPAAVAPAVAREPIVIRVTRKRATIVDGKSLKPSELDALLTSTFAEAPATKIVISEDKNLPVGATGDLLDRAKAIGFKKIEFAWSGH